MTDETIPGVPPLVAGRRRWDFGAGSVIGKRRRNRAAQASRLTFEPLEARVLLSADLNPLNTTALNGVLVAPMLLPTASPQVSLTTAADTTSLNPYVYAPAAVAPIQTAGVAVNPATPVTGALAVPGQVDTYTFTLTAAKAIYFDSLTNNSNINWSLSGPAGQVVNQQAFAYADAQYNASPVLQLGAGAYTISVAGSGTTTGSYGFRLLDLATAATIIPGAQVTDTLTPGNSTNAYQFAGTAGERLFLAAQSGSGLYWRLIDPSGQVVANSANSFSNEQPTLATGGQYTLLVEGYPYATTASQAFAFTVYPAADTSAALSLGQTVHGAVSQPGQLNAYTFTVASETRALFDSFTNDSSLSWSLAGPGGAVVSSRNLQSSDSIYLGGSSDLLDLAAGSYTLTVSGGGAYTGSYAFRLLNLAAATPIAYGVATSGTLGDGGASGSANPPGVETRLYAFTAAAGDQVQYSSASAAGSVVARLFDPYGNQVAYGSLTNGPLPTLLLSGTYTLAIEGAVYNTTPVNFAVTVTKTGTTALPPLTGTALTLGAATGGTFAVAGETDDYVFSVTGAARLLFNPLTTPYTTTLNAQWQLDGPTGTLLSTQSFYYNVPVNLTVPGTYRLRVISTGAAGQTYSFQVLDLAAATPVSYGATVSGLLNPGTQTKAYSFTASAGDRAYFDELTNTGSVNSQLLDPAGNSVFNQGFSPTGPVKLVLGGAYTLLVQGQYYNTASTSYSFAIQNVIDTTAALTLGATVNGSIAKAGQAANYTFNQATASTLYLDAFAQYAMNFSLTGPAGTIVVSGTLSASSNRLLNLTAGQYTLSISGVGDKTGAFAFRLIDTAAAGTSFNYGDIVSGANTPTPSDGVYHFTAAAGDQVYFDTLADSDNYGLQWQVLDPAGNVFISKRGFSPVGSETLTLAGTYTVLVEGYYYDTNPQASYSFRVSREVTATTAVTVDGAAIVGPISVPGQVGTALNFTGGEAVTVPNSAAVDQRNSVTIEFWLKPDQYGNNYVALAYKGDGVNASSRTYSVWLNNSGYIYLYTTDAQGGQSVQTASGSVPLGQWTHVAAVFDRSSGTMQVYLNGTLAVSGASRTQPAVGGSYPLTIGGSEEGYPYLQGALDDVRVFSGALTAAQIAGSYQTPLTGNEAGLALYLPMNEATGATSLTDASPNHAAVTVGSINAGLPGTITGHIPSPGSTNVYNFTLATATALVFDGLTDDSAVTVTLTGPNEVSVTRNVRNGDTYEFGSGNPVIQAPAGQYTITVTSSTDITGDYAFRFINLADAQSIAYDSTVAGSLPNGGQTLAYSFAATAGDSVYLNLLSWTKGGSDADFRLIDPYGNQVFGPVALQDIAATKLAYTGTYTLLVEGRTYEPAAGSYSFRLDTIHNQTVALTLGTNPAPAPYWTTGQLGGGLQLTGPETISVADSPALDLVNNVTLQAWIKVDQMPGTWTALLYKGTGAADASGRTYGLWLNAAGYILLTTADASGQQSISTANGLITPGVWVEVTGVIDRSNGQMQIYINGVDKADGSLRAQLAVASGNPLLIGGTQEVNAGYSNFQGTLDDVRVWSIALTGAQVAANYAAPLAGAQAGLALYLKLDDGAGTTLADSSGSGNVATAVSGNAQGVTGRITGPGQQISYDFTVTAGGTYYFDSLIDNPAFSWTLTGPQGTLVSARSFTQSDANRGNPLLTLVPGSYVLTVGASGATTGFFNFRLLPLASAQALTPGTPLAITLKPGNATQLYSFTATAGERVYFDQTALNGSVYVRVIDPLGNDLYGAIYAGSLPNYGVQTLALAGTYTVLVDGDAYSDPGLATMTFNVQPVIDKVATLALGTAVAGSIDGAGQATSYSFNVATATTAYFDSLTNNANLTWTLTGPASALVAARAFTQSDSYDQTNVALKLAAGAYTLTVRGSNDTTGAFAFNLLDAAQATPLAVNTAAAISLPALSTQLFSFSGVAGDRVQLLSSVVSGDVTWRLTGPTGVVVFGSLALTSEPPVVTLAYTGTYILAIEGRIYTASPIAATLKLIPLDVPAVNGAVSVSVPANQSVPVDLGIFAAGTYQLSGAGVASLVSSYNDPNALLMNPNGTPEVPVTRTGFSYLNPSGSPIDKPDGNIYGPGGAAINLGAVMGTLVAKPASPADYFLIGTGAIVTLATAGHIYAQVNDTAYGDNQYGFQVTVTPTAAATGATTQVFSAPGLPYALSAYSGAPASVATDATGSFLQLTGAGTYQTNVADFSSTGTGPFGSQTVDFDARITPGATRVAGTGIGAALLATASFGGSGPSQSFGAIPSFAGALGVGLTLGTAASGAQDLVTLTYNGVQLVQVAAGFSLAGSGFLHVRIGVQQTDGGASVSVFLTAPGGSAVAVINAVFVGGLVPDSFRVAFSGQCFNDATATAIDNVAVATTPATTAVPTLALNTTATGTIASAGGVERYQFTLAAPIIAVFDGLTSGNFQWTLTGPGGAVVSSRYFTQSDTVDLGSSPALTLAAGQYTLSVNGASGTTGAFAFKLDNLAQATPLTSGLAVTGTLDPGNSSALYSFAATAGQRFSVSGVTGWNGTQYYQVLDPNGVQVLSSTGLYQATAAFKATIAGTYTLLIEGRYYATSASSYGFTLNQVTDKAAALTLNAVATGSIDTAGQQAVYSFTLAGATPLYFDSLTNDGDLTWTLAGPDGTVYRTQSFNSGSLWVGEAAAGSYTLTVSNPNVDGHTGAFSFRILNLATAATAITPGTPVSGTLAQAAGVDAYSFTAAAGSKLYFDETARATSYLDWQLVDQYGASVFGPTNFTPQGLVTLTAGGSYTLLIQGLPYNTGTATYTFNVQPPATTNAALTLGAATNGAIATAGASNAYSFTLAQPARLVLAALSDTLAASYPYDTSLTYTIMGAGGVVATGAFNHADGTEFGAGSPVLALAAGSYTLTIAANSDNTGSYAFRLLDLAAATPLVLGTPVAGTLTPGSDTRAYSFTATAGARIFAQETSYAGGNLVWRLLDPNTVPVFYSAFNSSPGALTLPVAGTYTLLLEGFVGNANQTTASYGFTLFADPASNPIPIGGSSGVQAPDLVVTGLAATGSPQIQSGGTLTVAWTDSNTGALPTDASWTDRVIVSRADNGQILANVTLPYDAAALGSIASGAGQARQLVVTLPGGAAGAGALVVSVTTDAGNTVGEQNATGTAFTNNTAFVDITSSLPAYADLHVSGLTTSPAAGFQPGDSVTVGWTLANAGNAAVTVPFAEQISVRNTLTNQVVVLQSDTVTASAAAPFAAGASVARSITLTWPAGFASTGAFEFDVTADSTGQVVEALPFSSRTDNTASTSLISAPDLAITNAAIANTQALQSGATVTLNWTDGNIGNAATPVDWFDRVRVVDTTTGTTLVDHAVDAGGTLATGAQRARSFAFTLPSGAAGAGALVITITSNQDTAGGAAVLEDAASGNPLLNNVATLTANSTLQLHPDLVTVASVPASGQGGAGFTVGWTVTNSGSGATQAGNWTDRVILSTTATPGAASDVDLGDFARNGDLAVGAGYTQSQTVMLPAGLQGTYYVTVVADYGRAVQEPDTRADATSAPAAVAIVSGYADLATSAVTAPAVSSPGATIAVGWTVTNHGSLATAAVSWTDRVYLSQGTSVQPGDVVIGSLTHLGALAMGASYTGSLSVVLPANALGGYHVLVQTDAGGAVYQAGHTGDDIAASAVLTIGSPDLQVSAVTTPAAVQPGQSVTIQWQVTNAGLGDAPGGWTDQVLVSGDGKLSDAVAVGYVGHGGGLAAGGSYMQSAVVTLPGLADGTATFFVVADTYRQVTEANGETDNTGSAAPATVTHPDLAAVSVTVPATAIVGSSVAVSWIVANAGSAAIGGGWTDQVYLVAGSTLDGTQQFLGSVRQSGPLAAGAQYTGQLTVTLPTNLLSGAYHILVLTNAGGDVNEAGHGANNLAASAAIAIAQVPLPDLQVSGLAVTPAANIVSGSQLAVAWTLLNAGPGAVANSFYSHVTVVDTTTGQTIADQQVFYDATASGKLAGNGGTATQSLSVKLPDGVAGVGTLVVTVTADSYNQVYEGPGAKTDNSATITRSSALAPYADLVVNGLAATPAAPHSGDTLTVGWTTTNSGTAAVTAAFADELIVTNQTTGVVLADQHIVYDPAVSGAIGAGAGVLRSATVALPAGVAGVGTILVKVIADSANQVPELVNRNRTDNTATITLASTINAYPDLVVSNITGPAAANAGDTVMLSYTITNSGTGVALGNWADQISLSSLSSGAGAVALVGNSEINQSIAPGASVTRTVTATLPSTIDGMQYVVVRADSQASLVQLNLVSHAAVAAAAITITPGLVLSLGQNSLSDTAGSVAFSAVVTRSGSTAQAATVAITADQAGLLLPSSVTIVAGQAAAVFQVGAINSGITGPTLAITVTASAAGYQSSVAAVQETNANTPALTLMGPATIDRNAGTVAVTLVRNTPADQPLTVALASDLTVFIAPPATVTFAAGQSTLTLNLPLVDDGMVYGSRNVHVTAQAAGFAMGSAQILVNDTEVPKLSLALGQSIVSEAAGANATTLTVTRSVVTNQAVNVIVGTMPGMVRIGTSWQIAAGAASVVIPVGVVDAGMPVSSSSAIGISVAVADPSFGVPVKGTSVQTALTVVGSVGPSLGVALGSTTITGGGTTAGSVTRANGDVSQALTVALSSSNTNEATVPAVVVIAAGQASAQFTVTGVNDGALNSVTQLTITASAATWATGYLGVTVSNQNLPNLAVTAIVNPATLVSGTGGSVSYTVTNAGANAATGVWTDRVYLCDNVVLNNDAVLIGSPQTAGLAAGQSYTQTLSFTTKAPGTYYIIVVSDSGNVVQTINAGDKQRTGPTPIVVTPAYTATVQALTHMAPAGTQIILSGSATDAVTGAPDPFVQVTITITNDGFVRTLQAFTDPNGNFKIAFNPVGTESGVYAITAAQPNATPPATQDTFSLLGIKASASSLTIAGLPFQTVQGSFTLTNTTATALTGLHAALSASLPASATLTLAPIADLAGNGTVTVNYSFTSTAAITGNATINITSAQGAKTSVALTVSVLPLTPNLVANPGFLRTGMVVGTQSQVSFTITNTGGAESGPLTVSLPGAPWLSLQSPATIASIAAGGTATVTLQLTPAQDLALQEYQGSIVVAGAETSVTVPFNFRAVSTAVGDVTVTVQDEYTYFADAKPNLAGATVTLTDPYSLQVVATGVTDATGNVSFGNVAAGGYLLLITAPSHATLQASITVAPGIDNALTEFLHRQAVSYTWAVVPTTVADHYQIVLQSTFQTAVPIPVVTVDQPLILPLVLAGQTTTINLTFTNHGLIDATHLQVVVPNDPDFIITPLVGEIGVLPAMSSITIPVSIRFNPSSPLLQAMQAGTATQANVDGVMTAEGLSPQGAAGYGAAIAKCLGLTAIYDYVCVNAQWVQVPITMDTIGCIDSAVGAVKSTLKAGNLLGAPCAVLDAAIACLGANNTLSPQNATILDCTQAILVGLCGFATEGPLGVLGSAGSDILTCLCDIGKLLGPIDGGSITDGGDGGFGGGGYGGTPGLPYLTPVGYEVPAVPCGPVASFAGTLDMSATSMSVAGSVCAQVVVQLSQQAVVTRTAFVGTLDVMNAMSTPLTGVSVTLDIRDMMGNAAGAMFSTQGPTQTGFTGSLGSLVLTGGGNGVLQYTFLPTVDAAITEPMKYLIGGMLHYMDNGTEVDVPLAAAMITVYPEAKLNLDYFWQRNVIGDDPFTPQVEASEPFYLGLRATNVGAGTAAGLTITSSQPKIIENQKGLLVDFQIIGSQVQNQPGTGSLTVDLGTIAPGQTTTADWTLLSSLQGRFTNFSASFTHEDDGGSLRTSLINSVTIAPLIQVVHVGDDGATQMPTDNGVPSFLVENVVSYTAAGDAIPDTLYIGDQSGSQLVANVTDAHWTAGPGNTQTLTASASTGWSYIDIADPDPGDKLLKIVRSDGEVLTVGDTVWRTDRVFPPTLAGALDLNLVHLLDYNSTGSYTFTFVNDDGRAPHITALQDLSASVLSAAVPSLDVTFSKPIDLTTFTAAAVTLTLNTAPVVLSGLTFTDQGAATGGGERYRIGGLAALTGATGNYKLTVDGTKVRDPAAEAGDNSVGTSFTVSNGTSVLTSLATVTPNDRNTPVDSIDVAFSAAIDPASFTAGVLSLTSNGVAIALDGRVSVVQLTPTTFRIGGLTTLTTADGFYALSVDASQVHDTHGSAAAGKLTTTWTEDTTSPQVTAIQQITTNPRNTIVPSLVVTLSKPIDPASFDYHAVAVTQNGGPNLVTASTTVTMVDATHYRLAGFNNMFSAVTGIGGTYAITVSGAGLRDLAGNTGGGTVGESWVLNVTAPAAATGIHITPDNGVSSTDGLTNTLSFSVLGTVADPANTVRFTDLTTNSELGYATVTGTSFVGAVALNSPGAHQIRVRVIDTAGNTTDTTLSVFADLAPPTVTALSAIAPNPRTTPVDSVDVTLSKTIQAGSFTVAGVSLTLNGTPVALTNAVSVASLGSNIWRIAGLSAFDAAPGTYDLTVSALGLADNAGNAGTGALDESWVVASTSTGGFGGFVYQDNAGTGTRTNAAADPGVAGWTVFLDAAGTGQFVAGDPSTVTAADGSYSFSGLAPGSYMAMVVPQAGYTLTGATAYTVVVSAGQTVATSENFGVFLPGTLSGTVFDDANANGMQDAAEPGLSGVTVFLDRAGDGVFRASDASTLTDSSGRFSFTGIGPGVVRLAEILPTGDARTTVVPIITVTSGTAVTTLRIGDVKLGAISGSLYNDVNGDGARQAGEPGLAGWTVFIDSNHDGLLAASEPTTVTDASGAYSFTGLLPGSYTIGEVLQPGYTQTSPLAGPLASSVAVVTSGSDVPIQVDGSWTGPAGQNFGQLSNADAASLTQLTAALQQIAFANLDGAGETTVVIDTGIDNTSSFFGPAAADGIAGRIAFEYDFADNTALATDTNGHGSNVASVIAGSDATYPGVAPDANLIVLKVFDANGNGTFGYVQQALDWVAANAARYHIGVVNMSLGDGGDWTNTASRYGLGAVLQQLQAEDIITVAAAGNNYAAYNGLGVAYPASDPAVVAVGSVWTGNFGGPYSYSVGGTDYTTGADHIAAYSQRDPNLLDTLAPGSALTGANATGGVATLQGTSQASAYVAGAATLAQQLADEVLGRHLSTAEFVNLLRATGDMVVDGSQNSDNVANTGLSFPRLDFVSLFNAIEAMAGNPASVAGGGTASGGTSPVGTATAAAAGEAAVSLSEGQAVSGVDFGDFKLGAIGGTVFVDTSRDGVQNGAESGLGGVTVFIDAAGTGSLAAGDPQTVTDAAGHYSFGGIGPGSRIVKIVLPSGEIATSPATVAIAMSSGLSATANFGLAPPLSSGAIVSASGPATATIGQPYQIALAVTDPGHIVSEWFVDWGDGTIQGFAGNPSTASHVYARGGASFTVAASAMDDTGIYDAAPFAVTVGAPLQVVSVTPNASGVVVRFNDVIDPTTIHLYDSAATPLGAPDVTLVGASAGAVAGSIVFDGDLKGFSFIATGGLLAPDSYTLTLLSGANAFHDGTGGLDGAGTGVPGSANATASFVEAANTGATLSVPDFARAPGQSVDYAVGGFGLPITLANAVGIQSIVFHVDYDPALLTIAGVVPGSTPAGVTLTVNASTPGHAVFTLTVATPLPAGSVTIGAIAASVPATVAYGARQLLKIGIDSAIGGTVVGDNALQVVALLGDTDGNGQYDANDATLVQRVIVHADSGFGAWPDVDPVILADVARHGSLVTIDATRIAQEAVSHARREFPTPPASPYTVDPMVLQTGLAGGALASAELAMADFDAITLADGSDPADGLLAGKPMKIKLTQIFADFSLNGTAANAPWKGDFVTSLGAAAAKSTTAIRVTL